jgi:hypothetical protein
MPVVETKIEWTWFVWCGPGGSRVVAAYGVAIAVNFRGVRKWGCGHGIGGQQGKGARFE